jgi:NADH-quinone oxidoreductase subunit J
MNDFLFYIFSSLLVFASAFVVLSKNAVHSVLMLIFGFFNASWLFIMLNAEFIAMLLIIVYVGAVAMLFLFVVMMIKEPNDEIKINKGHMFLSLLIATAMSVELVISFIGGNTNLNGSSNFSTQDIGLVLYTEFFYVFQICGLILFTAMVGSIVIAFKKSDTFVKYQDTRKQVEANASDILEVKKIPFGEGVDV